MHCSVSIRFISTSLALLPWLWFACVPAPCSGESKSADIVVYGGSSAGIAAAIQADRMDHSVILVEPGTHLGGLTSGGLGFTDSGDKRVIGGFAREFYGAIKTHYDQPESWKYESAESYPRYKAADDAMWTFEPHVAERIFRRMLAETDVTVLMQERIDRGAALPTKNGRIREIQLESGLVIKGKVFVDATYEGDLMAAAKVPFHVGREANSLYGETLNGNQVRSNTHNHRFLKEVSPYRVADDPDSGLLPMIEAAGAGTDGEGDLRIQAYCFRMCISRIPENRVPFPRPANYDESSYELLFRNFAAGDLRLPLKPDMMPNGKTDTNNNCAVSTDYIGANYSYPEASYEERLQIIEQHEAWQKGLMWTLANHPRVPETVRQQMEPWGLAKDEFLDNQNWPHQLYIRESRRMVSDYVMTEWDCRRERVCEDSIGLGSYNMDSHNVRRYVTSAGFVQNEGDVQVSPGGPYLISYQAIVPPANSVTNLLVPVCLSASHIAYGSIRMEPVFMILGHSAATAAGLAIENDCDVQRVDYQELRSLLLRDGQVLDLPPDSNRGKFVRASALDGIVADDVAVELKGNWTFSTSTPRYVGAGYYHDSDSEKGEALATYRLTVDRTGEFDVRVSYSAHPNRASRVPIRIASSGKHWEATINQQIPPQSDGLFQNVARVFAKQNSVVTVTIGNEGTDGHVIIDAVQLLLKP